MLWYIKFDNSDGAKYSDWTTEILNQSRKRLKSVLKSSNIRFIPSPNVSSAMLHWKDQHERTFVDLFDLSSSLKTGGAWKRSSDKLPKRDHKQIQCEALPVHSPLVQQNPVPVLLLPTSPQTRSGVQTQFKHITCSSGRGRPRVTVPFPLWTWPVGE